MSRKRKTSEPLESQPGFFISVFDKIAESIGSTCGCCKRTGAQKKSQMYPLKNNSAKVHEHEEEYFEEGAQHDIEDHFEGQQDKNFRRQESELSSTRYQDGTISPKNYMALNYDFSDQEVETGPVKKAITKKSKVWTKKDDDLLVSLVEKYNGKHWRDIAKCFQGRTAPDCRKRFKKLRPAKKRKPWDPSEDQQLFELVKVHGHDWATISNIMIGRSGKQVRERYLNTLDPTINKEKWSKQEDKIILTMYYQIGSKWSDISKMLNNRPENMVKNRFYSHIKKKLIEKGQEESTDEEIDDISSETGTLSLNIGIENSVPTNSSTINENEMKENGVKEESYRVKEEDATITMELELDQNAENSEIKRQTHLERGLSDELENIRNPGNGFMEEETGFAFQETRENEERMLQGRRSSQGSYYSGGSDSSYMRMKEGLGLDPSETETAALEYAIQEADDKMKQAYYILSSQFCKGMAAVDLSNDIAKMKAIMDNLMAKKIYLESVKAKY